MTVTETFTLDARTDRLAVEAQAEIAFQKILALRDLTEQTGTITRRTQNQVLQSLPNDVLAIVAVKLRESK